MKRLTLLTILLVVVGLTAGALEVKPAFTLSGTGTLEWGIDLDTTPVTTGFKNSATGDLVVTLMAADGSDTHAGKDGWYGSISIANVELYWTDGAATAGVADANVTAMIVGMGGNLKIGVVPLAGPNGPDLTIDKVPAVEATADNVVDAEATIGTNYDGFGTFVSYNVTKDIMLGFEVVSELPWTTNLNNAYAFALDFLATFAPITVAGGVNMGFDYTVPAGEPIGFGVKVSADTAMIDPWVAFDGQAVGAAFAWEVGAGAKLTVMETVTTEVSALFDSADNLDLKVVFTEPAAKGLVDNLDATLTVYVLDLLTALEYEATLAGGYKAGILYPHFSVTYGDAAAPVDNPAFLNVTVGVTADILPLTQFALHWTSRDLLATPAGMGTIIAGVTVTY